MKLLQTSKELLADPDAPPALKSVALSTLLCAIEEKVPIPSGVAWLMWQRLKATAGDLYLREAHTLGEVYDAEVFADAVAVGLDRGKGSELVRAAFDVLSGSANAPRVTDVMLMGLVDVLTDSLAESAVDLVRAVHAGRGLAVEFAVALRDRWVFSPHAWLCQAGCRVAVSTSVFDLPFLELVLAHPELHVRRMAIRWGIHRGGVHGNGLTETLERRIPLEPSAQVRAELRQALEFVLARNPREPSTLQARAHSEEGSPVSP